MYSSSSADIGIRLAGGFRSNIAVGVRSAGDGDVAGNGSGIDVDVRELHVVSVDEMSD